MQHWLHRSNLDRKVPNDGLCSRDVLLACLAAVTTPGCCTSSASSAKAASRTSATSLHMALTSVLNRPCFTASLMSCGHCLTSSRSSWKAFLHRQLLQSTTTTSLCLKLFTETCRPTK